MTVIYQLDRVDTRVWCACEYVNTESGLKEAEAGLRRDSQGLWRMPREDEEGGLGDWYCQERPPVPPGAEVYLSIGEAFPRQRYWMLVSE